MHTLSSATVKNINQPGHWVNMNQHGRRASRQTQSQPIDVLDLFIGRMDDIREQEAQNANIRLDQDLCV